MTKRAILVCTLSVLVGGCSGEYAISISDNNLSDSYIHGLRLSVNEGGGFPGGLIGCSDGINTNSISTIYLSNKPEFVVAEWQHILSNKYYRAKVPLDERTVKWLRDPPFPGIGEREKAEQTPALIVQWRGTNRVAVMLVADSLGPRCPWTNGR